MNKKFSAFPVVIALAALLVNTFSVFAYSTKMSDVRTCAQAALVDIPSHRVDYDRLYNSTPCPVVASASVLLIPVTNLDATRSRFASFKDQQADLASGGNLLEKSSTTPSMDRRFLSFKESQAERMSH
jgi:hypothetical protein